MRPVVVAAVAVGDAVVLALASRRGVERLKAAATGGAALARVQRCTVAVAAPWHWRGRRGLGRIVVGSGAPRAIVTRNADLKATPTQPPPPHTHTHTPHHHLDTAPSNVYQSARNSDSAWHMYSTDPTVLRIVAMKRERKRERWWKKRAKEIGSK